MKTKIILSLAIFFASFFLTTLEAEASEVYERAAVGQKAAAFEASGSDGADYASSQVLSGDKRLVLIFFRGAW